MSFSAKVTARNIFRYKSRMLMTIIGVAGCTGPLVMGFGIRDSLQGIGGIQYSDIQKNDVIALRSSNVTKKEQNKLDNLLKEKNIKQSNAIQYQQLTKHIASSGSTISLKNSHGKIYHFKVNGICEMYLGHYIFMNQQEYEKATGKKYATNAYLVTMRKHSSTFINRVGRKLVKSAAIEAVISSSANRRLLGSFTGSLNEVIFILISGMLAVVVIYNLTNINVAERIRELSTIKVLGFYDNETTMYIYRETIILSGLGIIVGFGFGWWLHHFIITSLPPDVAMFDPGMYPMNFVFSVLIPAMITAALAIVVHQKIKHINMLDALSSID